jgi:hypothetical protein
MKPLKAMRQWRIGKRPPESQQPKENTTMAKTKSSSASHELKHAAAEGHKAAKAVHKVDSSVYMAEVLASGNPKRIRRYFLRKWAYKLFGKFMGKTINKI